MPIDGRELQHKDDGVRDATNPRPSLPKFALPEVVGVAMSAEDVADVVQQSVDEMAAALECPRLIALSYAPAEGLLRGVTTAGFRDQDVREIRLSAVDFQTADRALRTDRILIVDASIGLPARLSPHFSGDVALIPLALGSRPLAILIGQPSGQVAVRSADWQERAREIAARAALVVELERVASAYHDSLRLRQSTHRIATAILEGRPLREIGDRITEIVAHRLREERVGLYLRSQGGSIDPVSLRHISPEYGENIARLVRHTSHTEHAAAGDMPYHALDVQQDPAFTSEMRALFQREGIQSILVTMLRHKGSSKGALVVYPSRVRQFTPAELNTFQGFADQATLAVAITQLLDQERAIAIMAERNRLAREMHDTVAQSLAGLILQIEVAESSLDAPDTGVTRKMLEGAHSHARQALDDTRRAVHGLSPAPLERLSPPAAVAEEAAKLEAEEGVPAQFVLTGEEQPLLPEQGAALLRIAQEALNNVRKHAHASRVRVGLNYSPDDVTLMVDDDGDGFDASARSAPDADGGYGLFGMIERARLLGGEVQVESTAGWGTRIRATLPYRPASALVAQPQTVRGSRTVPEHQSRAAPPAAGSGAVGGEGEKPAAIRVLVVDDHAVTRHGIRALIEAEGDIVVVGEAADGAEGAELAAELHPDVVLMDLQMPGTDGFEGIRRVRAAQPDLPVVVLTTLQTDVSVAEALRAGARGFLLKDAAPSDLIAVIRAARRGESLLSPAITSRLAAIASGQAGRPGDDLFVLNDREREVLDLLAQGARNKEIAARLFIAPKTVEYHLSDLFSKLDVSNRTEAVRAALERGLIGAGPRGQK